jgi:hypothetical protein
MSRIAAQSSSEISTGTPRSTLGRITVKFPSDNCVGAQWPVPAVIGAMPPFAATAFGPVKVLLTTHLVKSCEVPNPRTCSNSWRKTVSKSV